MEKLSFTFCDKLWFPWWQGYFLSTLAQGKSINKYLLKWTLWNGSLESQSIVPVPTHAFTHAMNKQAQFNTQV